MKFPAYPRYKPSGVQWLCDIPEQWKIIALKRLVSQPITDGPHETPNFVDAGIPFVSAESIWDGKVHFDSMRGFISRDSHALYSRKYLPRQDDIFVVKSGSTTGKIAIVDFDEEFNIWSPLAAIRCNQAQALPRFLFHALSSDYFQGLVQTSWSFGTQPNIGMEVLENLILLLPPIREQFALADFLDRETGRIDRLIAKKLALIEKLKEKRTALISHTVTRGLPPDAAIAAGFNPNPPLKQSGIEWIGEIPLHWGLVQFRRQIKDIAQGTSPNASSHPALENERGVLKLSAVNKGEFLPNQNKELEDFAWVDALTPERGDLLISRSNTPELVGDTCVVPTDHPNLLIPDLIYRVKVKEDLCSPHFACWFILSEPGRAQIQTDARGSSGSMVKLGQGHIKAWCIPDPPMEEQYAIAAYLDRESAGIKHLMGKIKTVILRLQEYRTALITAAVTGKIDVCNFQRLSGTQPASPEPTSTPVSTARPHFSSVHARQN